MFIWDFLASFVLDQIVDWIYNTVVGFLGDFFALMGQMGAELFDLPWVEAVTMFFGNFAWALYITGIVMAGLQISISFLFPSRTKNFSIQSFPITFSKSKSASAIYSASS